MYGSGKAVRIALKIENVEYRIIYGSLDSGKSTFEKIGWRATQKSSWLYWGPDEIKLGINRPSANEGPGIDYQHQAWSRKAAANEATRV